MEKPKWSFWPTLHTDTHTHVHTYIHARVQACICLALLHPRNHCLWAQGRVISPFPLLQTLFTGSSDNSSFSCKKKLKTTPSLHLLSPPLPSAVPLKVLSTPKPDHLLLVEGSTSSSLTSVSSASLGFASASSHCSFIFPKWMDCFVRTSAWRPQT